MAQVFAKQFAAHAIGTDEEKTVVADDAWLLQRRAMTVCRKR
jgi:hypothetical protein